MKNSEKHYSYKKLTTIVLIIVVSAILLNGILRAANVQKIGTMRKSARNFAKNITLEDVYDDYTVYLYEAIDNGTFDEIKSPFGRGGCDINESKVVIVGAKKYVTLKCHDYLIDNVDISHDEIEVYKVSKWSDKKNSDDDQVIESYNCTDKGKKIFDEIYDKDTFLYYVNKKYETGYQNVDEIEECKVEKKRMYRKIKLVD